jgi:spermidine synthase
VSADTILLENGGTILSLDEQRYLVVAADALLLMRQGSTEPVYAFYRSPTLVNSLKGEVAGQLERIRNYEDDLQTRLSGLRLYERTAASLAALEGQLERALARIGDAGSEAAGLSAAREIFASAYALRSGVVALQGADGTNQYLSHDRLYATEQAALGSVSSIVPAPTDLTPAVISVLRSTIDADTAEINALSADVEALTRERDAAQRDLAYYQMDQRDEGPNDLVDYGTSRMRVQDAIARTFADLALINRDLEALVGERTKLSLERNDFVLALRNAS